MHQSESAILNPNISVAISTPPGTRVEATTATFSLLTTPNVYKYNKDSHNGSEETLYQMIGLFASIISFAILVFVIRIIYGYVRTVRRENDELNDGDQRDISIIRFTDSPPPYPGRYSRTNINYLPSYDSAMEIERMRNTEVKTVTSTLPVIFSVSSDSENSLEECIHQNYEYIDNSVQNEPIDRSTIGQTGGGGITERTSGENISILDVD